jgi:hypothetical protein
VWQDPERMLETMRAFPGHTLPGAWRFWREQRRAHERCPPPKLRKNCATVISPADTGEVLPERDKRLNIPVFEDELEGYKRRSKAAGYSTMAEWVRRVLAGHEKVEPEPEADRKPR